MLAIPVLSSTVDLCDRCARGAIIQDDTDEFREDINEDGTPTLHHAHEDGNKSIRLRSVLRWDDDAPEFPAMLQSATGEQGKEGCRLCRLVHQALKRRRLNHRGPTTIMAAYVWGGNRDRYLSSYSDDGLVYMRCEVFSKTPPALAYIVFGVQVADHDLSTWLRSDGCRQAEPLSPDNVEWIRSTLVDWDEDPGTQSVGGFVPSRLVYVGVDDDQTDSPRLVLTEGWKDPLPKYAALSYCWGPGHDAARQLTTKTSNLDSHLTKLPQEDLTPVLRDAIAVCRSLSIPYIWIDAVCIVQDDSADWSSESEVMGYIYYHAYLTICPLAASSCMHGFLEPRTAGVDIPFQSQRHPEISGLITLVECYNDRDIPPQQTTIRSRPGFDLDSPLWMDRAAWLTDRFILKAFNQTPLAM
ncbi:tol-like protein [Grosmannia clavigera kw1407]|uniref:Tol-like protein n=1 Tax=Grosmannia clavigera (strain kw1407 / UAMH 11150) TaxID=655863 RepID=F0XQT2_GROCL|nr:tol-like protein [Grosmannia clavigera kw1407]EFW99759.1 tol-like protein [Grosmannia clavigera kw1407]